MSFLCHTDLTDFTDFSASRFGSRPTRSLDVSMSRCLFMSHRFHRLHRFPAPRFGCRPNLSTLDTRHSTLIFFKTLIAVNWAVNFSLIFFLLSRIRELENFELIRMFTNFCCPSGVQGYAGCWVPASARLTRRRDNS